MADSDSAPQGGWTDTPPVAPPAPAGQAPSPTPTPASTFDSQAYLATLPAAEREAKASLPAAILEADSKRQMLRTDYDRKRGTESETLRTLTAQNQLLVQQNQQMVELIQGGGRPQAPEQTLEEVGKKLYEADNPGDYTAGVVSIVEQTVGQAVAQAIENNPAIRQLSAGVALRQSRSSAPDVEEADLVEGQLAFEKDLAARGATIGQLDSEVIKTFFPQYVRTARAERLLKNGATGGQPPAPPATPQRRVTLPVSGSGISSAPATRKEDHAYGPKSTLASRMDATLRSMNLTPQQLADLVKTI